MLFKGAMLRFNYALRLSWSFQDNSPALTMRWPLPITLRLASARNIGEDPHPPTGYFNQAEKTSLMSRLVLHRRSGLRHVDRISPCFCTPSQVIECEPSISKKKGVGDVLVIVSVRTLNGEIVGSLPKQSSVLAAHSVRFSMHLHFI